jgi:hypothetical protein
MLDDGRLSSAYRLGTGPKAHVRIDEAALDEWRHSEPAVYPADGSRRTSASSSQQQLVTRNTNWDV